MKGTTTSKENQQQQQQQIVGNNNLNYSIPITTEEQQQQQQSKPQEMKRSLSKSKSNSQKISDLAACVGYPATNKSESRTAIAEANNHKSNTVNRKLINNGFNSLRRMLKMSTTTSQEPLVAQNQNKTLGSSTVASRKKNRNKCLSASATPLPSCLAPQRQFNNADSYTESQNSAYSSVKPKPKVN